MRLSGFALLFVLCAACAETKDSDPAGADAQGEMSRSSAISASDQGETYDDIAPFEADGLPGQAALEEAIRKKCGTDAPKIRQVSCVGFEEESTEFSCEFEFQQDAGNWEQSAMTIAIDGRIGWLDIGGPECELTATSVSE